VKHFVHLRELILKCLNPPAVLSIISISMEELFHTLHDPPYWDGLILGHGGLQQLVLDLRFAAAASEGYMNASSKEALESLIRRSVSSYCSITKQTNTKDVLLPDTWIKNSIENALKGLTTVGKLLSQQNQQAKEKETADKAAAAAALDRPRPKLPDRPERSRSRDDSKKSESKRSSATKR